MMLRALLSGIGFSLLVFAAAPVRSQEPAAPWTAHAGAVSAAHFTPDGRLVVSSGLDGTVRIWNAADGALLRTYDEHEGQVLSLAVSPDGRTAASGSRDNTIRLWDVFLPWPLADLSGHEAAVRALVVSSSGEWTASAGEDKSIILWNRADDAEPVKLTGHTEAITALAANADESQLASGDAGGELRFWSTAEHAQTGSLGAHVGPVVGIAWHATESQLISAGADGSLKWWQLPLVAPRDLAGHTEATSAVAASADGALIASAGADKTVRLFDVASGEQKLATAQQPALVHDVAVTADGSQFAAVDEEGVLRIWAVADGAPLPELRGHVGPARTVAIVRDGKFLFTGGDDGTARMWQTPTAARVVAGQAASTTAAMSADGKWFAAASSEGGEHTVVVRDSASGAVRATLSGHEGAVTCLSFSADAARLVTGSADKTARVWNLANGEQLSAFTHEAAVRAAALSADGNQAFSGGDDKLIKQWTVADGTEVRTITGHTGAVSALRVAGPALISGSADATIRIWNVADGAAVRSINHGQPVTVLAVTADGTKIAGSGPDKQVRTFTAANGAAALTIPAAAQPVTRLAWSPDGSRLLTSTAEAARIWDLEGTLIEQQRHTGAPLAAGFTPDAKSVRTVLADGSYGERLLSLVRIFAGHEGPVRSLALSANGQQLVTASDDKTARLWNVADGQPVRTYTGPQDALTQIAISLDGARLFASSLDKSVHVWTLADGAAQPALIHPEKVAALSLSRDGTRIATACDDGLVRIWDVASGREWERMPGHPDGTADVLFLGEAFTLASTGADKLVRISTPAGLRMIVAHESKLSAMALTTNGAQIATAGDEPVVRFWNTVDGAAARQLAGAPAALVRVAIRPDDQQCAAIDAAGKLFLWNLANNQLAHTVEIGAPAEDLAYSGDGARVAVTTTSGLLHVYETGEAQLVQELAAEEAQHVVRFGPDRTIVTGGADSGVHVWAEAAPVSVKTLSGHGGQVNDLAFSADGALLSSASSDQTARVWDVVAGSQTRQFSGHTGHVYGVAFAPDGERVVTGGVDGTARVWDVAGGNQLAQLADGDAPAPIFDVAISPDGARLAACGPDGAVRIWNIASGALERTITSENESVRAVVFNESGTRIAGCSHAGTLTVWNTADGASLFSTKLPVASYQAAESHDASRIVAAGADGVIRIVDVPAGAR